MVVRVGVRDQPGSISSRPRDPDQIRLLTDVDTNTVFVRYDSNSVGFSLNFSLDSLGRSMSRGRRKGRDVSFVPLEPFVISSPLNIPGTLG